MDRSILYVDTCLLRRMDNDGVVRIPRDVLQSTTSSGSEIGKSPPDGIDAVVLEDLVTGYLYSMPVAALQPYSTLDAELGNLLQLYGVSGIKAPYRAQPAKHYPSEVPLHGNITEPTWASVNLGGSCNSRCVFCYTEWTRNVPNFTSDQVKRVLDRIAAIGTVKSLVFTGGEATIRKDLGILINYARSLGFSDITLQTNGRVLKNQNVVKDLTEQGLMGVLLSIHGSKPSSHDKITGKRGSFEEALVALRNLAQHHLTTTINVVVCKDNYLELEDIPGVIREAYSQKGTIRFSYPIVEGAAFDNLERVLVSFSDLRPKMAGAMSVAQQLGFDVEIGTMPLCLVDNAQDKGTTYDKEALTSLVQASPFYKFNIPRGEKSVKLQTCQRCTELSRCQGIQVEYLKAFPETFGEFKPIR